MARFSDQDASPAAAAPGPVLCKVS
jgi:hypothetical protein